MNRRNYVFSIIFVVLILSAYPLYQMAQTRGILFYQNAFDEATYLQYDYSRINGNLSRPTQLLVTLIHKAGFSAGWVNFMLDTFCLLFFPLVFRKVFFQLGYEERNANVLSLLAMLLPALSEGLNPLVNRLFYKGLEHGLLYWVTLPETWSLPILRSPEPQLSLLLLGFFICLSLRVKKYWPLYFGIPFFYSFISIPMLFIVLSLHLNDLLKKRYQALIFAPVASFIIVSFLLWANFSYALSPEIKEMFVRTRLPLLSLTSCASLLLVWIFWRKIEARFRYLAFLTALSPMVVANQQVLTGWFFHPTNYEQYFGVLAVTCVLVLAIGRSRQMQVGALIIVFLFIVDLGRVIFKSNLVVNNKIQWTPELANELKSDSAHVAVNDVELSSRLSMAYSKQPITFFAYSQIFPKMAPAHFKEYLCLKQEIMGKPDIAIQFKDVFAQLDNAYRYTGNDFILIHVGRKSQFDVKYDPNLKPENCPPVLTKYFLVRP